MRIKTSILITFLLIISSSLAQNRIPPPPCYGNGNSGFGGAIGEGHILFSGEGTNPILFAMYTSENDMNDILVFYIDTGTPGRNVIDANVDDNADDHRIAITNSNAFGNASTINFPPGFEASYAVSIDVNSGGLWSIPNTGIIGAGDLHYISSVNSTLTSSSQIFYEFNFDWEDIGLTTSDEFQFVGVYVSSTANTSDEGYGSGIMLGTQGSDNITFTQANTFPGSCNGALGISDNTSNIKAYYSRDHLYLEGVNGLTTIQVLDILGREMSNSKHQIVGPVSIPLELTENEVQFIVIENNNKRKVIKAISH